MSSPFRGRVEVASRLRRMLLPLKWTDSENDDVLPLQGEVAAKRTEGAQ